MPCVAGLVSNDSYSLNRVERQLQAPDSSRSTTLFATDSRNPLVDLAIRGYCRLVFQAHISV